MVKVKGSIVLNPTTMEADVSLFADTQSEVVPNVKIQGMPEGYSISAGSSVMTANGDMAFMKSDGNWNWL